MTEPAPAAILSFPKCGRTWLRLMLKFYFERVFELEGLDLDAPHDWRRRHPRIPKLEIKHDGDPHFQKADELGATRESFADRNVIFIARDPRDVIVSLYFEMTKRIGFYDEWGFDTREVRQESKDISTFLRGGVGRLDTLLAYYRMWGARRHEVGGFHLVRYEDMHTDAGGVLAGVVDFLGLAADREAADWAAEMCRFDRMRDYESKGAFDSTALKPADRSDPESFKVRRGQVGGYVDYLGPDDIAYLNERCRALPDFLADYRTER